MSVTAGQALSCVRVCFLRAFPGALCSPGLGNEQEPFCSSQGELQGGWQGTGTLSMLVGCRVVL